jgi:hypothetical protein
MFKSIHYFGVASISFALFSLEAKSTKPILSKNFNTVGRVYMGKQSELDAIKKSPTTRTFVNDIVYEEIVRKNGIILEQSHAKDIVSFVDRFYGHEASTEIWKNNIKTSSLDQALQENNLVEAFIYFKKVSDSQKRIELLEKYAAQGHVIFMFEWCKELSAQENQDKKIIATWFMRAMIRLIQDIACHRDASVQAAFEALVNTYMTLIQEKISVEQKDLREIVEESFEWVSKLKTLPSPVWVGYHGLSVFNEGLQVRAEKDWEKRHKKALVKAQESFYKSINTSNY